MKIDAIEKGYSTCFVVAFRGSKKLNLSDVLNSEDK